MKSFYLSYLLIHLFSPCHGLDGLPFLTLSSALLCLPRLPTHLMWPLCALSTYYTHPLQDFHTYSSLCMESSSLRYLAHALIPFRSLLSYYFIREMPLLGTLYKSPTPLLSFFGPLTYLIFSPDICVHVYIILICLLFRSKKLLKLFIYRKIVRIDTGSFGKPYT